MRKIVFTVLLLSLNLFAASIAQIDNLSGSVFNETTNKLLMVGDKINSGDILKTFPESYVSISTDNKTITHISSDSRIKFLNQNIISLEHGRIWVSSFNKSKNIIFSSSSKMQFINGNFLVSRTKEYQDYVSMNGTAFITDMNGDSVQIKKKEFTLIKMGRLEQPQDVTLTKYSEARSHFAHINIIQNEKSNQEKPTRSIASVSFVKEKPLLKTKKTKRLSKAPIKVYGKESPSIPVIKEVIERIPSSTPEIVKPAEKEFQVDDLIMELKELR